MTKKTCKHQKLKIPTLKSEFGGLLMIIHLLLEINSVFQW